MSLIYKWDITGLFIGTGHRTRQRVATARPTPPYLAGIGRSVFLSGRGVAPRDGSGDRGRAAARAALAASARLLRGEVDLLVVSPSACHAAVRVAVRVVAARRARAHLLVVGLSAQLNAGVARTCSPRP